MSKPLVITLLIGLLFILSGCGSPAPSPGPPAGTPTAAPGATAPLPSPVPGPPGSPLTAGCTLLDSHDVASLFSSAEVEGPIHQVGEVSHPIFSTATISATESSCTYLVFHKPGSAEMQLLQITYWVDVAGQTAAADWARVWAGARSSAAQVVPGIGDDAFYDNGRLSYKKGSVYVTIEIVSAGQNIDIVPGSAQQLELEKQMALDALGRMG
jgi:hypothetical protein